MTDWDGRPIHRFWNNSENIGAPGPPSLLRSYGALVWPASRSSRVIQRERKLARPAGLEPATLGLEGCVPVSEAALLSAGYENCHADVPRGSLLQGEEEVETLPHSSKLALQTFTVPAGRTAPGRRSH